MSALWGIDLGGTKIEGVILKSAADPEVLIRTRVATEREKGTEHILKQIEYVIRKMQAETGLEPQAIGMGTPGSIDPPTQLLKNSNTTILNGLPFQHILEDRFQKPFFIANDANCFAVAEARMGIVRQQVPDARLVFGVIMGTGVGGGLVIDGEVWNGRQGIGGEWGHSFLDESGGPCYCGNIGCVENVLSGTALESYYAKISGEQKKLREIIQLHKQGADPKASETVARLLYFLVKAWQISLIP